MSCTHGTDTAHLLSTAAASSLNGMYKRSQIALQHIALLHAVLQVVTVAMDVEAHVAIQSNGICAVNCDAAPVGAAGNTAPCRVQ